MQNSNGPFISSEQNLPEITLKVIVLSVILTVLLAMSNAYLALKIGILASASIPAAIISMGVLRFIKGSNILENNLVQTAASAGEAVAGGIVYTTPALILIHFWDGFNYWENFFIAFLGGSLGVLFSIPLRRVLVTQKELPFPEGQAIAQVLITGTQQSFGLKEVVAGGAIGALLEFSQMGLKVVSHNLQCWFTGGKAVFGFGAGFSPTMIGVGYLIGFNIGFSMLIGAALGWFLGVPILSFHDQQLIANMEPVQVATTLWSEKLRYVGIGAMLLAGLWSLFALAKPFAISIYESCAALSGRGDANALMLPRTERDLPMNYVLLGIMVLLFAIFVYFLQVFPLDELHLGEAISISILLGSIFYILIIGFIFCAITGYFSGLVGVTATPGSAIIIAGLLIAAVILRLLIHLYFPMLNGTAELFSIEQSEMSAAAITIFLGAIITSAAAIANDNFQDLKVGHILGATPWKQQLMLLFGVIISAAVIPLVMQLLFNVYGLGDVLPRPDMDITQALPAPPAAMMAAITQGVFNYDLPWDMLGCGGIIVATSILVNTLLPRKHKLSILGVAMGIYLPLSTSIPLFVGGLLSLMTKRNLKHRIAVGELSDDDFQPRRQTGILIACGLVSGAALMNIVLAVPFVLAQSPDVLDIMPAGLDWLAQLLGVGFTLALCYWIYRKVCNE